VTVPTIRVDDDVYGWLKSQAEPFTDTPNSVLRRLAGLDGSNAAQAPVAPTRDERDPELGDNTEYDVAILEGALLRRKRRARRGELLDRREYDIPILKALDEMGGSGHASDVVDQVGTWMVSELTDLDMTENDSGVVRWRNRVMWRRLALVRLGLLKDDSPRGVWEISDEGRQALWAGQIDYGA